METTHGPTIAFGNKRHVRLSSDALQFSEWVLSIESMLLALKVPQRWCLDTTLEPQWQFAANHFSLVAYHRITAVSKLHLSCAICNQEAGIATEIDTSVGMHGKDL